MKKNIIAVVVIIIIAIGAYFFFTNSSNTVKQGPSTPTATTTQTNQTPKVVVTDGSSTVIGKSVEGRDILAYHYGKGDSELLFVGGTHGGYEWNSALVAYQTMDYLKNNPDVIPANVKVTVIPVLNPDGLNKVVGTTTGNFTSANVPSSQATQVAGRFNANKVDLNRNFDCDWKSTSKWQNQTVSGGTEAFSEPESQAFKTYIETNSPVAVVGWYSSAGGVYASGCNGDISAADKTLTSIYAKASGYPAFETFDSYAINGDMMNWVAKNNIPAISVLLTNHTDTEWTKNQAGILAVLKYFTK